MQVLVGGLTVAVIYSLVFAYIRQEGFAYSFTDSMIVALGAMGIAFVLWVGMGIGFETTWPFWLYYAALLAIMSVFKWRRLSKVEEAAEVTLQKLCSLIDDFAHFAREYNRSITVFLDGRRIFVNLVVSDGDELRRRCQRAVDLPNQAVKDICFGKYIPTNGDTLIYMACGGGTIEDWRSLKYTSSFGTATGEEFRVITRKIKSRYSNFQENMQGVFHINFYRDQ